MHMVQVCLSSSHHPLLSWLGIQPQWSLTSPYVLKNTL